MPDTRLHFVHSWWTRPQREGSADGEPPFWLPKDYELLTWLTSALQARRFGSLQMVTDTPGARLIERLGLDPVYDGSILTTLDDIPASVLPRVFWSAAPLYALRRCVCPVISLDLDAILWAPPPLGTAALALLQEDHTWPYYRHQQARYAGFGFDDPSWDWSVAPVNAGVVGFFDDRLRAGYVELALGFIERFSQEARASGFWGRDPARDFDDAPVFVDQRLLPMYLQRQGSACALLGRLHPYAPHLRLNPTCTHLWFTKRWYDACPTARRAYCDYLRAFLREHHPLAGALLRKWEGAGWLPVALPAAQAPSVPRGFELSFSLLEEVEGTIWIWDANVRTRRRAVDRDMLFVAEELEAGPGARYRLVPGGQVGVRIRHLEPEPCAESPPDPGS